MNIESSRISTIFNSGESEGPQKIKPTFKGTASIQEHKKKKHGQNPNDLNNWEICDPDKFEDPLPQPFRLINKIIYKTIMTQVNAEIERIDKAKLSHNYEKGVREIVATNFFDFSGISCFANHRANPQNQLLVGDKLGNVLLLDLNKRSLTTKKEVVPERRIIDISAVTLPFEDTYLTTFSVVLHATQEVYIYRYKISDYKMNHVFTIKCAKSVQTVTENTEVGEFAYKTIISPDCSYISVTLYNGNVEVYKIPEPPFNFKGTDEPTTFASAVQPPKPVNTNISPPKPNLLAPPSKPTDKGAPQPAAGTQPSSQHLSTDPIELYPFRKIALKSPEVPKDPAEALLLLLNGPPEEANPVPEKGKDAKDPKAKAAAPPKGKEAQAKEDPNKAANPAVDVLKKEYKQNPVKVFKELKRSYQGDESEQVEAPLYYPDIYYIQTAVVVQDTTQKQFSFEKVVDMTSDIVCVWKQTNVFEIYELDKVSAEHVPTYIFASVYKPPESTSEINPSEKSYVSGHSQQRKADLIGTQLLQKHLAAHKRVLQQPNAETPVLAPVYSFETIYPITCSSMSKSSVFLGLGLKDGTVVVWDLVLNQQKYVLDKHKTSVTVVSFFEDWRIISGSKDGAVHLFDLQSPASNIKYQHVFQMSGNAIAEIGVNDTGIAFVIDSQRNLRAYDLFHFQKIFVVTPVDPRGKKIVFSLWPLPILNTGKEQLCIVADEVNQEGEAPQNWNKKGCILIYRILDNLMATFPGLASIVKKGIDKSKAMVAFSKLQTADLNNPNFDVPLLAATSASKNKLEFKSQTASGRQSVSSRSNSKRGPRLSQAGAFKDPSLTDLNQTYVSMDKEIRKKASPPKKVGLTAESLHPEKYLTQKQVFPKPGLVNPVKKTMDKLREVNQDKVLRTEKLQHYYTQIQEELDRQEEIERLQKRRQMLKDAGH